MSRILARLHSRLRPARGKHTPGYTPEPWVRMTLPPQVDLSALQSIRHGMPYREIS